MHFKQVKSILSPKNGMNLYRGCSHGCIYCDSRSSIYNMNHEFEDIEVKENGLELLRKVLKNKREKVMVGTGSMADPYMPLEKRLEYTRSALKLIHKYGHGFTCITKSDLILRDLDLIKKINENTKAVVQMTLTTADEDLCKILEPNVCTTKRRVEVLETLNEENIPTIVWLCPILPFINDTEENINQIKPKLRDIDRIHLVSCGEFEDLLPKSLIVKTVNSHFKNFLSITEDDLISELPTAKVLEELFKRKGLHEFKKADFAKLVRDKISEESDLSVEIRSILREIFYTNKMLDSKFCS